MITGMRKLVIALGLATSLTAVAGGQEVAPAASPQGSIVIPEDVTLFGKNNPNHRRATAVVNARPTAKSVM